MQQTQINTSVIDSRDSKYIEGNQPSQLSKTMNNELLDQELNLEELEDISAGLGIFAPVVASFAAGYAVGTVVGKVTGLIP